MNMEIYKNVILSEYELYAIHNEIDKIKSMNIDEISENNLIDKIYYRACEQNNLEIVKYLFPFVDDIYHQGFYACLYYEHIEIATYIFDNMCTSTEQIKNCQKKIVERRILEVLFVLNKYKSIDFMLNTMFEFTFITSCSKLDSFCPYPIMVGIKKNNFDSIKVFLDYLIKNNENKKLIYFCDLATHHAFHTTCDNNYVDLAKYLCDIIPFYSIIIENNIITKYDIDYNKYKMEKDK